MIEQKKEKTMTSVIELPLELKMRDTYKDGIHTKMGCIQRWFYCSLRYLQWIQLYNFVLMGFELLKRLRTEMSLSSGLVEKLHQFHVWIMQILQYTLYTIQYWGHHLRGKDHSLLCIMATCTCKARIIQQFWTRINSWYTLLPFYL